MERKMLLKLRRRTKKKKPRFRRQEYFKHQKLEEKWRAPRGRHSKLRRGEKARGKKPTVGYSSPRAVRGLNRRGLEEVRIFNPEQLDGLENKSIVIASSVGRKKRMEILAKAEELGLNVANR